MVTVARVTRKSTRSKSGTSSSARKPSRSTGVVESPPISPPAARFMKLLRNVCLFIICRITCI
ncbi:unnamed protein product [Arabidopsis halleri]